jgi:hypothetical protein
VAFAWTGPEKRRAPRIDVMMRVEGQLASVGATILVQDLSRTGFAVISRRAFSAGETLDFRLVGPDDATVVVTAEAVHTRPVSGVPHLHLSGFRFVPGRVTGLLPQVSIDRLIRAVSMPEPVAFFRPRAVGE